MIHNNVKTDFISEEYSPQVDTSAYLHPMAAVIGHVIIGKTGDGGTICCSAW